MSGLQGLLLLPRQGGLCKKGMNGALLPPSTSTTATAPASNMRGHKYAGRLAPFATRLGIVGMLLLVLLLLLAAAAARLTMLLIRLPLVRLHLCLKECVCM